MALQSINPANGDLIASYEEMTIDEVKGIIADVDTTFKLWRNTSFAERGDFLKRAGKIMREKKRNSAGS